MVTRIINLYEQESYFETVDFVVCETSKDGDIHICPKVITVYLFRYTLHQKQRPFFLSSIPVAMIEVLKQEVTLPIIFVYKMCRSLIFRQSITLCVATYTASLLDLAHSYLCYICSQFGKNHRNCNLRHLVFKVKHSLNS